MIELETILRFLNVLFIPLLIYIVKIEKRITALETKCHIYFNGKKDSD